MLVTITQEELDKLDDVNLIWHCMEPTILLVRGKNFAIKSEAYASMTTGQRALLMFQMLYGHSHNGVAEFFAHLSYLLSQKGVWEQLKEGMQFFGADDMLKLLVRMESLYNSLEGEKSLEGSALLEQRKELDLEYQKMLPETIKHIGTFIRKNPDEFLVVV